MCSLSLSIKGYHVSNDKYSIATANHGVGAMIKIWTAQRSSHAQGQVSISISERLSKR
jgi:hypothetical protein